MDEPRNSQSDKDRTLTPTLPLSQSLSVPSSPSSSQDDSRYIQRGNADAHRALGLLRDRRRSNASQPLSPEDGDRQTLTQSR